RNTRRNDASDMGSEASRSRRPACSRLREPGGERALELVEVLSEQLEEQIVRRAGAAAALVPDLRADRAAAAHRFPTLEALGDLLARAAAQEADPGPGLRVEREPARRIDPQRERVGLEELLHPEGEPGAQRREP